MQNKKNLLQIALAALVLAIALPTLAQAAAAPPPGPQAEVGGPGGPPAMDDWWNSPRIAEKLGLSADQQKKISDMVYQHSGKMIDLRADLQKARMNLHHLLSADTLDDAAIGKAADQLNTAECALNQARVQLRVDIARMLTRDQRVALRDVFRERMGEGRGKRQQERMHERGM